MKILHASSRLIRTGLGLLALLAPSLAPAAETDVAAVLARARAAIGSEAAIAAVTSLQLTGTLHDDGGTTRALDIVVRRPLQQHMTETLDQRRVTIALDNYTGWRREELLDKNRANRVVLMNATEVRRMRANTWQSLYFYENIAAVGGTVTAGGEEVIDGIACEKLIFTHPGDFRFERAFDRATGRLVVTRTNDGTESRESGEILVDGLRFPQELRTTSQGKTTTVVFDRILINPDAPDTLFAMPSYKINFTAGSPPADAVPATP